MNAVGWRTLGAAAVVLLLPGMAGAQSLAERTEVRSLGGALLPEEASALDAAPLLGVQVAHQLLPAVSVGFTVSGARTTTRERFFRPVALDFGTRLELWDVRQSVSALQYGLEVGLRLPAARFAPYVSAGAGGYTLFLSGEANQEAMRVSGAQLTGAAGLSVRINDAAGLMLEVRDHIWMDYDQEALNPARAATRDQIFYERWPAATESKDRVSALALTLGFTYHP